MQSPALNKMNYCNSESKLGRSNYSLEYSVGQDQQNIASGWCE